MTNAELGKYLARELFKAGDFGRERAQRIQFKGGRQTPVDPEIDLGGFGEGPLADWFTETLNKAHGPNGGEKR